MTAETRRGLIGIALAAVCLAGCVGVDRRPDSADGPPPAAVPLPAPVAFMSDFSTLDDAVGACKGVMLRVEPRLTIADITHQVKPFGIADGARFLANVAPYYPRGTVFLTVIDPGVGTPRKPLVARSKLGHYYVLPDNGLLTFIEARDGLDGAREIKETSWTLEGTLSSTFHGRDIFSPVAARLARGDDWTKVGPAVADIVRLGMKKPAVTANGVSCEGIALDGAYGNLITNLGFDDFRALGYAIGDTIAVKLGKRTVKVKVAKTFGDVPVGDPLLYQDSTSRVALAVNQGNFAQKYGVKVVPLAIELPRKKN